MLPVVGDFKRSLAFSDTVSRMVVCTVARLASKLA